MQDSLAPSLSHDLPMAAEAFVQCRVTAEVKTLLRVLERGKSRNPRSSGNSWR